MRSLFAAISLLLLSSLSFAEPQAGLTLHLNQSLLRDLDVEITPSAAQAGADLAGPHYRALHLGNVAGALNGNLLGASWMRHISGSVLINHAWQLRMGATTLSAPSLQLINTSTNPLTFELRSAEGAAWFVLQNGHPKQTGAQGRLLVSVLQLKASAWLSKTLGKNLDRYLLGGAELNLPFASALVAPAGQTCPPEPLRWPTLGFQADVALELVPNVYQLRCEGCTAASTAGLVAIAPSARLRNVGTADVPWFAMFSGTPEPYGADQHPFLVWNLFRLDADGTLKQLGASGVKHAFFSTNSDCPCPGAQILYAERCTDEYDAFTNDIDSFLTERSEVIPSTGLWARCGSLHDPDCSGTRNHGVGDPNGLRQRMLISEAELAAAPGRKFFIEAWYVTRDDIDIFNSMATLEVLPSKDSSAWAFVNQGVTVPGPLLTRVRAQAAAQPGRMQSILASAEGRVQLNVAVTPRGNGTYRYRYELMNFEFALVRTSGALPNLRLLSQTGIQRFGVPQGAGHVSASAFADIDANAGNDWTAQIQSGQMNFIDQGNNAQSWGRLYRFEWVSSVGPQTGLATLAATDVERTATHTISTLVPANGPSDLFFWAGFEAD